jgi:hypothetical protein
LWFRGLSFQTRKRVKGTDAERFPGREAALLFAVEFRLKMYFPWEEL